MFITLMEAQQILEESRALIPQLLFWTRSYIAAAAKKAAKSAALKCTQCDSASWSSDEEKLRVHTDIHHLKKIDCAKCVKSANLLTNAKITATKQVTEGLRRTLFDGKLKQ